MLADGRDAGRVPGPVAPTSVLLIRSVRAPSGALRAFYRRPNSKPSRNRGRMPSEEINLTQTTRFKRSLQFVRC